MMKIEKLVLGGGCFWCTEAVYSNVKGVIEVVSGYAGGARANPTYENICTGATGHAEVVEIKYDSEIITLDALLDIFFAVHNPTTLNQQGADRGTQYRSIVYYENDDDKEIILESIEANQIFFRDKIITEISELPVVYKAEEYHQNYFKNNPNQGYCQAVVAPKVQKLMTQFPDLVSL